MKELWKANPFHLMNSPFAEMSYSSSGLNIVPERLLLATRRPSTHHPLASGAAFFDPLRAIRPPVHHAIPASPSQAIRHRTAQHPSTPARHPLAPCRHLLARTDALNGPQNKPSAQAGALNPCKNTFCVIVNCPLQIKPVFLLSFHLYRIPYAPHSRKIKFAAFRALLPCAAICTFRKGHYLKVRKSKPHSN